MSYPPGGEYDERLLASAPVASRAERQQGYNVNILDNDQPASPAHNSPPSNLDHNIAGGPSSKEGLSSSPYPSGANGYASKSVPWYQQGKWRIIMLIGAVLVIGAVVGGAVGGTVGKNSKTNTAVHSLGPSTATIGSSTPSGPPTDSLANPSSTTPSGPSTDTLANPSFTTANAPPISLSGDPNRSSSSTGAAVSPGHS